MTRAAPAYPEGHSILEDKTVLITAAAGAGIGFATAKRCIEEGARVMISDIHEERLAEAAAALSEITGMPTPCRICNVTDEDEVLALIGTAEEELGHIDVLVNNAGLGGESRIVDMSDEAWSAVQDVTLNGTFRMTRAALKHMYRRESGVIVNISSVIGWRAQPGQAHYAAAKAGVMALTRVAAAESAEHGVRVNAVSPSFASHPFLEKVMDKSDLDRLEAAEMYGRGAETWEVANVIVFLASDYSTYMTGEVVSVSSQHP